jgi:N-acetylneuraminic acid mutarotase
LEWHSLPALPDAIGFAGSFAGVSADALLVAGGANFPDRPPWEGGKKVWHDRIFALVPGARQWTDAGRLPCPNGYGISVTVPQGVVLIGGGDATRSFADVWLARFDGRAVSFTAWPTLPMPLAMAAGALVGRTIYVAGGIDHPDATRTQRAVYTLDLDRVEDGWQQVDTWPGPGRILAVGGAHGESFYVFGGTDLYADAAGKPQRTRLRDAWRYTRGSGWKQLADLPRRAVAAPSPAPVVGGTLLILGGDDGVQASVAPAEHRGFPREVLAYVAEADRWESFGSMPFSFVTSATASWQQRIVVPGGETRPGIRSPETWAGELK